MDINIRIAVSGTFRSTVIIQLARVARVRIIPYSVFQSFSWRYNGMAPTSTGRRAAI